VLCDVWRQQNQFLVMAVIFMKLGDWEEQRGLQHYIRDGDTIRALRTANQAFDFHLAGIDLKPWWLW
jgi:hypothetical protein